MSCITSADVDETRRHEHTWGRRLSGAVHRITRWFCSFKTRNKGVVRDLTWLVSPYIVDLTENQHMGYIYVFASAIPHTNNAYSNLPSNHYKWNVTHIHMLIKIGLFWVISCIVIRLLTWFNFSGHVLFSL